jgi:hypothetical protein
LFKEGVKIVSGKLKEWCGLDVGSRTEALGVEDQKTLYLLKSAHPNYVALFRKSKVPINFATMIVQNFEEQQELELEALADKFCVKHYIFLIFHLSCSHWTALNVHRRGKRWLP